MKVGGRIVKGGLGCFLEPPKYPEHYYHVECEGEYYCLSSALECEWISGWTKRRIKRLLDNWEKEKLPLTHPKVKEWIYKVLGYFRNSYSPDGINRSVLKCEIKEGNPFEIGVDKHLGVMFIRQFYPEYEPTKEDFENAKWGK